MAYVVTFLGGLVVLMGLWGLISPVHLIQSFSGMPLRSRFHTAVLFRFVFGMLLVLVAPQCRFPVVVRVIGFIAMIAAVVVLAMGFKKFESFIRWWLSHPPSFTRSWSGVAIAFGALLIYASL